MQLKEKKTIGQYDAAIDEIAKYADSFNSPSKEAVDTARYCLADSLGCALLALNFPECTKLLEPYIPGTSLPLGARVPGTHYSLDPLQAAFNIGTMVRWLDYNDTWLAAEWGHPSDNLGGLLAIADIISRQREQEEETPFRVKELLTAMIMAHEIQGGLALMNSFNKVGFDHVIFVKVATAAVATKLLGGGREKIAGAVSNAFVDAGPLRTYRHAPNTGSRKSWAAGDQTSRGLLFALMAMRGEMGYPTALTAERWGLYDVLFGGKPFQFQRPFGSYVMENVLFKISFPAEFHAQTAVECAIALHPGLIDRFEEIGEILIETHESAIRIIDKKGPLNNPADRDHCLQYMTAVALLHGNLKAEYYEEKFAKDPRIDRLREKMRVVENKEYSRDYLDPEKRSIPNALTVTFADGTKGERVAIEYPIGHKRRRKEGIPLLFAKFEDNLASRYPIHQVEEIMDLFREKKRLEEMPLHSLVDLFAIAHCR